MHRLACCLIATVALSAEDGHDHAVIPEAEQATEAARGMDGPTEHVGIAAAAVGAIALDQVPELADRQVRARVVTIAPGGKVAVHEHDDRPGFAYILSGQAVEHRSDREEPVTLGPGEVAFEKDGVVHWWHNPGEQPVRALVVDLVPQK